MIKEFDNLTDTTPTTVADLSGEVQNYWDRGLLGLALDPNFPTNPVHLRRSTRTTRRPAANRADVGRRVPDAAWPDDRRLHRQRAPAAG